jgi:hypothetical protein
MDHEQQGGRPQDIRSDEDADGQWMTANELSQLRGISKASAARLVRRRKWRRRTDNLTGIVRVLVPHDFLARTDSPADARGISAPHLSHAIKVLELALAALRERAEGAEARAARVEAELAGERSRGDLLRQQIDQQRGAEEERQKLSRWQRIRRAWRGG